MTESNDVRLLSLHENQIQSNMRNVLLQVKKGRQPTSSMIENLLMRVCEDLAEVERRRQHIESIETRQIFWLQVIK